MIALLKKRNREIRNRFDQLFWKFFDFSELYVSDFDPEIDAEKMHKRLIETYDTPEKIMSFNSMHEGTRPPNTFEQYKKYFEDSIFFYEVHENVEELYREFKELSDIIMAKPRSFFLLKFLLNYKIDKVESIAAFLIDMNNLADEVLGPQRCHP